MRPGQRFGFSAIEKRDVWNRWKAGQSLHEIGRAFDTLRHNIFSVLATGDIVSDGGDRLQRAASIHDQHGESERGGERRPSKSGTLLDNWNYYSYFVVPKRDF